jgi:hypothetical protein
MGLLDDAIRQHLDLKRQHGAPEEELLRQEEEALGPARRDVTPADGDGEVELETPESAEETPAAEEGSAAEEAPAAEASPAAHEDETVLHEPESEAPVEPEAAVEPVAPAEPAPPADLEPAAEPKPPAEPDSPAEPPAALYDAAADLPPVDEKVAEEEPPGSSPEELEPIDTGDERGDGPLIDEESEPEADKDADVLEDTPDFLQETPEHDRLWFEQKPPRDFDFD